VGIKQVSVTRGGHDPVRDSGISRLAVSADGRYVAFSSEAGNLVQGDHTIYVSDVFVRDTLIGTTVRASVDAEGGDPNSYSLDPSISADGRYVSFQSGASDLVAGDANGLFDVFVRDLLYGTTVRASVDAGGGDPNGTSGSPSISADGRYVAFYSAASDLIRGGRKTSVVPA
jgi:Tol biopolymer transport system component